MADASDLREQLLRWADDVFSEAVERMMVDELREAAPLGETGDTRRGIEAVPGGTPTRLAATIRSNSPHGDFVEKGTRPHLILPRNAKVLRFTGGGGRISQPGPNQRIATRSGGVQFAAYVNHPGNPPYPWFDPVVQRYQEFLERAAARVA